MIASVGADGLAGKKGFNAVVLALGVIVSDFEKALQIAGFKEEHAQPVGLGIVLPLDGREERAHCAPDVHAVVVGQGAEVYGGAQDEKIDGAKAAALVGAEATHQPIDAAEDRGVVFKHVQQQHVGEDPRHLEERRVGSGTAGTGGLGPRSFVAGRDDEEAVGAEMHGGGKWIEHAEAPIAVPRPI